MPPETAATAASTTPVAEVLATAVEALGGSTREGQVRMAEAVAASLAEGEGRSVQSLVGVIDAGRGGQNLSSAIRLHVLDAAIRGKLGKS